MTTFSLQVESKWESRNELNIETERRRAIGARASGYQSSVGSRRDPRWLNHVRHVPGVSGTGLAATSRHFSEEPPWRCWE
jgi:hypothetical protein